MFLQEACGIALLEHKRMSVHTGHQAQADCSPYRLCNLSLVFWSQPGVPRVLYAAHLGHVLRHDGEVLLVQ